MIDSTHLYAFGSVCRGEVDSSSDIDLLACLSSPKHTLDPQKFSIYSYDRIKELWKEGNPFSWHLHLESKLVYSSDGSDFIVDLGKPRKYTKGMEDCDKFSRLFKESSTSLISSGNSVTFNLSCMFLAARNFATCYSLHYGKPVFSRTSPLLIENKLVIDEDIFDIFARARILSTRGYGTILTKDEIELAKSSIPTLINWMNDLSPKESTYE
jgi:hypothetical protein